LDTKLKKLGNRFAARLIAFALVVALTVGAGTFTVVGFAKIQDLERSEGYIPPVDLFSNAPYFESTIFASLVNNDCSRLVSFYRGYGNVDPNDPQYDIKSDTQARSNYEDIVRGIYENIASDIRNEERGYDEYSQEWLNMFPDTASPEMDGAPPDIVTSEMYNMSPNNVYEEDVPTEAQSGDEAAELKAEDEQEKFASEHFAERFYVWTIDETGSIFDLEPMAANPNLVSMEKRVENEMLVIRFVPAEFDASGVKAAFEQLYAEQLEQIWQNVLATWQESYDAYTEWLETEGLLCFIGDGNASIANVRLNEDNYPAALSAFEKAPAALLVSARNAEKVDIKKVPEHAWDFTKDVLDSLPEGTSLYLAYDEDTIAAHAAALTQARHTANRHFIPAAAALLLALIFFIWLIVVTGRKREDETRRLYALDKVFVEIQLAVIMLAAVAELSLSESMSAAFFYERISRSDIGDNILLILFAGLSALLVAVALWCFLSLIRNIKAGLFLKRSIIWRILTLLCRGLRALFLLLKSGFDGKNPFAKTLILVALVCMASAIGGMLLPFSAFGLTLLLTTFSLAAAFTWQRIVKYGKLKKGIDEIAGGNLQWQIPVAENARSEFDNLSRRINAIGAASNIAIQNELKNQRLKTDLISNVSHDLKTPLTSIITYTDLLKKEGLRGKNAQEYLKIIDEKSRRLQKLTEDLFDAAKASSGAIPVRREKLDLLSLLNQAIAEMAEGLAAAELEMIVGAESEHCYVLADSQLLWRVVDNLLANVSKYAMPGSRVYVDIREHRSGRAAGAGNARGMTVMEMKNISKAKLNIPADELMERFKRGDESRTTDGSGLGLAIAKDLVRLQGGQFEISIDGDLFKTVMTLEACEDGDAGEPE
jgi:signal transduction histidine kinase